MNTSPDLPMYNLPSSPVLDDFDVIFSELHDKVSDFFIQPEYPVVVRYRGGLYRVTTREITRSVMNDLIGKMVSPTRAALIKQGEPQSWSHRVTTTDDRKHDKGEEKDGEIDLTGQSFVKRFRCNCKSVQTEYSMEDYQIVMRCIPNEPMDIENLNLPVRLVEGLFPKDGMVLFSGPTGSGKTTTLAACMKKLAYDPRGKVIITIEDPIEYNLHGMKGKTCVLTHAELERNVRSYPLAMRAALRENPDVLMTGEMRDEESMMIAVEAAGTGHALYSTLHTNSVTSVFSRVAQKLDPRTIESSLAAFIEASRTFVFQRLYPSRDGGMVAVIEYICLTKQDNKQLIDALKVGGVPAVTNKMNDLMDKSGQWYPDSAKEALDAGKLSQEDFDEIVRHYEATNLI